MGDTELLVRIAADVTELKAGLGKGKKEVRDFAASFHDIQGGINAAIQNVQRLAQAVKAFVSPALEAEESAAELTAALKAQGITSTKVRDGILEYSGALQRSTTYGDEAITEAQKLLIQLGKLEGEGLKGATKATLDLAAGLKIDLRTAAMLMGKAAAGETGTLGRYGLAIEKSGDKSKDFAAVLRNVESRFGGAAAAAAATAGGAFKQFSNATGELVESLGKHLLPHLETAARFWKEIADSATRAMEAQSNAAQGEQDAQAIEALVKSLNGVHKAKGDETKINGVLEASEYALLRAMNIEVDIRKTTLGDLRALIPYMEKQIAVNREAGRQAKANADAQGDAAAATKVLGTTTEELVAFFARLDSEGDEVAAQLKILEAREKALRTEMENLAKAGELVTPAMMAEARALREQIDLTENARAREAALARVKEMAAEKETERAEALEKENAAKREQVRLLAAEKAGRAASAAEIDQQNLRLEKQAVIMSAVTSAGNALGDAFVGIAIEGKNSADVLRDTFRQLAMDIVRQAIAMIVAKAGEAAAKTIAANAGVPGPAGIALALGGGAAIFAATVAYKEGIPGFEHGGKVGGRQGRDRNIVALTRGEEVLTQNDPRHVDNGGGGGLTIVFNSVMPPNQAELETVLRDHILPAMKRLQRYNMG